MEHQEEKQQPFLYRFLVGILIGSGFIVPGVSGGALAAIFGIYERIIGFLANRRQIGRASCRERV